MAKARVGYIFFKEENMSKVFFEKNFSKRMETEPFEVKIARKAESDAKYAFVHEYPWKTVERWQQTMRRRANDRTFYGGKARHFYKLYLQLFRKAYGELAGLGGPYDKDLPSFDYEPQCFVYASPRHA